MGGLTACNGTTLFVYGYEGGTAAYDLETGHMQTEAASAAGGEDYPSSLAADADGNLYLLSEKGVRRAVPGGTLAETVMEGQHVYLRFPAGRCARLYGAAGQHLCTGRADGGGRPCAALCI